MSRPMDDEVRAYFAVTVGQPPQGARDRVLSALPDGIAPSRRSRVLAWTAAMIVALITFAAIGGLTFSRHSHAPGGVQLQNSTAAFSPSASGDAVYTSARWLYSINYPMGWHDVPVGSAPENAKYFGSASVDVPANLGDADVWVSVIVQPDASVPCRSGPGWARASSVMVDGEPATLNSGPNGGEVYLRHRGWCYSFSYIVRTPNAAATYAPYFARMLTSFRFNR